MQEIRIPPLVEVLTEISDWRKARGKRYRLVSLLGLLILGLLCGKYTLRSISRWGKALPARTRERLELPEERSPSPATLCRVLWHVALAELAEEIEQWVEAVHEQLVEAGVQQGIAIDGKTIRRAASLGARDVHLLGAVCHQLRLVLAQLAVDDKTNEITTIRPLLEKLLLKGVVVTVDALLTQRDIARQIRQAGGHYIMYVKENQPKLRWAIQQLFIQPPRFGVPEPASAKTVNKHGGRVEVREIATSAALNDYLDWPGLTQVFQLTRTTTRRGKVKQKTVYGITSLTQAEAEPAQLLTHIRNHWAAIENGIHWVRDVVMGEDESRIHKGTAPQAAATLRNLAINLARIAGFDSITAAADAFAADPTKALSLMGF